MSSLRHYFSLLLLRSLFCKKVLKTTKWSLRKQNVLMGMTLPQEGGWKKWDISKNVLCWQTVNPRRLQRTIKIVSKKLKWRSLVRSLKLSYLCDFTTVLNTPTTIPRNVFIGSLLQNQLHFFTWFFRKGKSFSHQRKRTIIKTCK